MQYTDLKDAEVVDMNRKYIDINADGRSDFFFEMLPVSDPAGNRNRRLFYAYARAHAALLNADPEQTPALKANETIGASFPGYEWFEASTPLLTEEITPVNGNAFWEGNWKDAAPAYLPVKVHRNSQVYFGWIQMSVNKTARKLILHKAALSTEATKTVKAGM